MVVKCICGIVSISIFPIFLWDVSCVDLSTDRWLYDIVASLDVRARKACKLSSFHEGGRRRRIRCWWRSKSDLGFGPTTTTSIFQLLTLSCLPYFWGVTLNLVLTCHSILLLNYIRRYWLLPLPFTSWDHRRYMISRSRTKLSTTLNRLLVGLCVWDIIFSFPMLFTKAILKFEDWKLIGNNGSVVTYSAVMSSNQAACSTQGFFITLGMVGPK